MSGRQADGLEGTNTSQREVYETPAVRVWGDIEDLTKGDTGATYDTGGGSKTV